MTVHTHADAPEFHLVVRRTGRGPLAPYRLAISIVFAIAISGAQLWAAAHGRADIDRALILAGLAGLFAWLVVGRANAILKSASTPSSRIDIGGPTGVEG